MPRYSQRPLADVEPSFNVKPTAEHRWPRGYTPERQAAVSSALASTETHVSHHGEGSSPYVSTRQFFTPGTTLRGGLRTGRWSRSTEDIRAVQAEQGHRVHTDILARSTVPLEHMQDLPPIHVGLLHQAAGSYHHPGAEATKERYSMGQVIPDPLSQERGRISIDPVHAREQSTLIHEIGHHIDYQTNPEQFKQRSRHREVTSFGSDPQSPALEGYAEGYAQRHTVPRRGESVPDLSYKEFIPQSRFQERYSEASGGMLPQEHPSVQKSLASAQFPEQPGAIPGQGRLFQRNAPSGVTSARKDWGQHPLEGWQGGRGELGTIQVGRGQHAR